MWMVVTTTVMFDITTQEHSGYVSMKKLQISDGIRKMSTINYHMKMKKIRGKECYERIR